MELHQPVKWWRGNHKQQIALTPGFDSSLVFAVSFGVPRFMYKFGSKFEEIARIERFLTITISFLKLEPLSHLTAWCSYSFKMAVVVP